MLRATTACTFSTSQLPKVVRTWCVLHILTSKCASRHNGVQFFIAHLASWLRTRRFSEPTFRPSGATNHWKNTVFRDFPTFSRICIFFLPDSFSSDLLSSNLPLLSASALLCFSSAHIVGSLTSKLPSITVYYSWVMEGGWWFWALPQPTSTVDFHYAPIQYSHYIDLYRVYGLSYALHSWSLLLVKTTCIVGPNYHSMRSPLPLPSCSLCQMEQQMAFERQVLLMTARERDTHWFYMHTKAHTRSTKDHPNTRTCIYIYIYMIIHIYITYHLITYLYEIDQCKTPLNHVESWCSLSFWETSPSSEFPFFVPPCDLRPFCASWSWSKL